MLTLHKPSYTSTFHPSPHIFPEEEKPVSEKDRERILQMGENFREVWESEHCRAETKKKIAEIEGQIKQL